MRFLIFVLSFIAGLIFYSVDLQADAKFQSPPVSQGPKSFWEADVKINECDYIPSGKESTQNGFYEIYQDTQRVFLRIEENFPGKIKLKNSFLEEKYLTAQSACLLRSSLFDRVPIYVVNNDRLTHFYNDFNSMESALFVNVFFDFQRKNKNYFSNEVDPGQLVIARVGFYRKRAGNLRDFVAQNTTYCSKGFVYTDDEVKLKKLISDVLGQCLIRPYN